MKYLLAFSLMLLAGPLFAQTKISQINGTAPTDFSAIAMDGSPVNTSELRGKIVVLNLWFINCPNCLEEIQLLNRLVDEYKDKSDVVFLGLAASKKRDLESFLTRNPFKYKIVPDAAMIILSKFGTPDKNGDINVPFPMHYVLDRDGNIVVKAQGIKGIEKVKTELKRQFESTKADSK